MSGAPARWRGRLALLALAWALAGCVAPGALKNRILPPGYTGDYTLWWNDSQKKEQGSYVKGLRQGFVRTWNPDGSLASEGRYEHGVPVGELVQYYPTGGKALTQEVHGGALDGPAIEYHENGEPKARVEYSEGRKQGSERRWDAQGHLLVEGRWNQDLPSGRWTWYAPDGAVARTEHYWNAEGRPVGYLETVYEPAGHVSVQTLRLREEDSWRGWVTLWHPNGIQAGLVEYVDGLRQGRDVSWDEQGHKLAEGRRAHDKRVGTWSFWNPDGSLKRTEEYGEGGSPADAPAPAEGGAAAGGEAPSADGQG